MKITQRVLQYASVGKINSGLFFSCLTTLEKLAALKLLSAGELKLQNHMIIPTVNRSVNQETEIFVTRIIQQATSEKSFSMQKYCHAIDLLQALARNDAMFIVHLCVLVRCIYENHADRIADAYYAWHEADNKYAAEIAIAACWLNISHFGLAEQTLLRAIEVTGDESQRMYCLEQIESIHERKNKIY